MTRPHLWRLAHSVSLTMLAAAVLGAMLPPAVRADNTDQGDWIARVDGTDRLGAQVRTGPGTDYAAAFALPEGSVVRVIDSTVVDDSGHAWCPVALGVPGTTRGWIARELLVPVAPTDDPELPLVTASHLPDTPTVQHFTATVTAYTYQKPTGRAHGSITRSGTVVHWGTVAVDPV